MHFVDNHFYRLRDIVRPTGVFPFCASTWWAGVKSGRYPKPIKLGPRITAWSGADLNALLATFSEPVGDRVSGPKSEL
jgi:predicted DNA-binding transcriptional regulator AlpA